MPIAVGAASIVAVADVDPQAALVIAVDALQAGTPFPSPLRHSAHLIAACVG